MMVPLRLEQVSKQYGDKTAVDRIEFEVQEGEIYGLLGANGAGKTTTMRMVLGLIYPDEGQISYSGKGYSEEVIGQLGYLPEERGLYPKVRVCDQLIYLAQLKGMKRKDADRELKRWLEKFEVTDYYGKKVEELSKGNQQKIQFIAAVLHQPKILVLDEAFSGLDPVNVELLKATVKELRDSGTSILFSTHRMEHVEELCQRITILHRSKTVLSGTIKTIKQSFPKEKIVLRTEEPVQGLEQIAGVNRIEDTEQGRVVYMDRIDAAQEVLQKALAQSSVHRFEIMEPTLNEIFIKAVGGEARE
ncbi:putative ABC transporter ATP-binding protein YhaQ [Xylanibacillus composti]|uniref:Putative ABC transporter ATP-binding protein YhaQ n=2 Tax=Xylanibacillus composti TaxID=1572762 RepID=A0A8J4GZ10_9BACL|nr:putative ABC transporter ATP-binding protein YhaQ [Xylanibacillus composti]